MKLFEFVPAGATDCTVEAWIHMHPSQSNYFDQSYPAIILCPGGGYGSIACREAAPVAEPYFAAGYNVFILRYSVMEEAKNFKPLCQLAATIAHIRKNAAELITIPDKIAVMGFSAGGHLAASLGTLFNNERFLKVFDRSEHIRPDAMILGYPVITGDDEFSQIDSIERVSGAKKGTPEYRWFDLTDHVSEQTPPTFLWHTAADQIVPVENSLLFSMALSKYKIPYECHILPEGPHGMCTCTNEIRSYDPYNARWVDWCIRWLNQQFNYAY